MILLTLPMFALGFVLGCPCCGPPWYRRYARWCYQVRGLPLPPELA